MTPVSLLAALICAGALAAVAGLFPAVPGYVAYAGAAVGFGLAPGLALAARLHPAERLWLTLSRALFLSPLLSGAAASGLLYAGMSPSASGLLILGVSYPAALISVGLARRDMWNRALPRWERRLVLWLLVLGVLALLPHALRDWVRERSDAVFHTAVTLEILARGVPPQDPYFAGTPLNYIWFYHALLAVWSARAGVLAWDLGGLVNACWLVSLGGGAYALSRRVGRPGREAFFASLFVVLGLSCLFYLWSPVKVLRAFTGETAGAEELRRLISLTPFTFNRVWETMSFFHSPPPLLNKFLVMSAFGGGITAVIWLAEGMVGIARSSRQMVTATDRAWAAHREQLGEVSLWTASRRWQGLLLFAAFGSWVWHPAMGIAAGLGSAMAGLWFLARPGRVGRTAVRRVLLAYLGGTVCAVPVLLMSVGNAESAFPVGWTPSPLAILFGSTGALLLGLPALWRLRGTAPADLFRVLAVCWMVSAFFVVLPHPNTQDKLPFAFFLLPGAAAGWTLARWARALKRRKLGAVAALLTGVILVPATGLILAVYLFEAGDPSPTAAERELYTWVAETTPPNAVFVDTPERDDLLVRANRRQLWGREPYALQWGYPVEEMDRRRRVRDLLTPEGAANTSGGLAALDAYAAEYPVYLVWRPADHGGASAESSVMARFPSRFQRVWDNAEATVYVYRPS